MFFQKEKNFVEFYDINGNLIQSKPFIKSRVFAQNTYVDDVLDLPEIYKLDDRLAETRIVSNLKFLQSSQKEAVYFPHENTIIFYKNSLENSVDVAILLHELQHKYDYLNATGKLAQAVREAMDNDFESRVAYISNLCEWRAFKTEYQELYEKYRENADHMFKESVGYSKEANTKAGDDFRNLIDLLINEVKHENRS